MEQGPIIGSNFDSPELKLKIEPLFGPLRRIVDIGPPAGMLRGGCREAARRPGAEQARSRRGAGAEQGRATGSNCDSPELKLKN